MPALKLFISHSSRLDDVEHKYTREDRNWCLLEDTCAAIWQKYGDRVEVLVDKDGLIPGEDWNHRLNLWLAECHVAIVLFSKRAVEKSDWVAKEAAILSWRAGLDKDFTLIPVMLDGESTPEDLAKDFLGVLRIDTNQCIRNAKTAGDILAGIVRKLGGPEDAVAAVQGWNLLAKTMTSRTRLESLTVEVDQLRRLNDAQARGDASDLKPDAYYLNPGLFWWAFRPETARTRGLSAAQAKEHGVRLPYPGFERVAGKARDAVLLIEEIDKAEPDLPDDLLEPLDRRRFDLPEGFRVGGEARIARAQDIRLLTVITTNGERELPQAFLRRCVTFDLPDPDADKLVGIGLRHFPVADEDRIHKIAARLEGFRTRADELRRRPPGTAEFLDAVRACEDLDIDVSDAADTVWTKVENAVLVKDTRA